MDSRNSVYHNCIEKPETITDSRDEITYQREKGRKALINREMIFIDIRTNLKNSLGSI